MWRERKRGINVQSGDSGEGTWVKVLLVKRRIVEEGGGGEGYGEER